MSIFSGSKKKEELVLVFNIGSASVSGALFFTQKSGVPKIIFSFVEPIKIEEELDSNRFLSLTLQTINIVANKIYSKGLGAPVKIFCVLSSAWYVSETRIITFKKNTSFTFTTKLADELIQKEIKIFEEENQKKYDGVKGKGVRPIELKNIQITLNGYRTQKPVNQKAKELEMTIFISMCAEQILKNIEETVAKYFHFDQIKFSSFLAAYFSAVRDMHEKQENFLLVDVGGEITDISMVKNRVLKESISFPLGVNFLIRGVSRSMGCSLEEAKSLISLFKDGHAEKYTEEKLLLVIDKLKKDWLNKFQESLAHLSHDISIPATIFIILNKSLADFFCQIIKTEQFSQYTLTESKFEIIFLGTEFLHNLASFEEKTVLDPFLIIDSVYINRFLIYQT